MIEHAIQLAMSGDKVSGQRVGAIIVIKNKIVAMGQNLMKSHPLQKKFGRNPKAIFQHAEINALVNFLRQYDESLLQDAEMYVARVKGKGMQFTGAAKPCEGCQKALDFYNLSSVYFTEEGHNELIGESF